MGPGTGPAPVLTSLRRWPLSRRGSISIVDDLNAAYCALSRWPALAAYIDDGTAEIDNNAAERALRGVALRRKNWLFAGSDRAARGQRRPVR